MRRNRITVVLVFLVVMALLFTGCGNQQEAEIATNAESTATTESPTEHIHEFGEWKTTKEASCTEDGLKERSCSCGERETETIPAKGHSFGEWEIVSEADYANEGLKERVCSVCGEKESESIPKLVVKQYQEGDSISTDEYEFMITDIEFIDGIFDDGTYKNRPADGYGWVAFTVTGSNKGKEKYRTDKFKYDILYGDGYVFDEYMSYDVYVDPLMSFSHRYGIKVPLTVIQETEATFIEVEVENGGSDGKSYERFQYIIEQ